MAETARLTDMRPWHLENRQVEERWLGLDRRKLPPALMLLAVILLLAVVLPFIDRQIVAGAYEAGATQTVHDQVVFAPAAGWIPDGTPAPSSPALKIFRGGVSMEVAAGAWRGSAEELLANIRETARGYYQTGGEMRSFTLESGMQGAGINLYGVGNDGLLVALVAPATFGSHLDDRDIGVRIVVRGPAELVPEYGAEVAAMLASFRPLENLLRDAGSGRDD